MLLNGFASIDPQAVGLLLVGPNSNNLDFFSWAGGSSSVSGLNLTIDDLAGGQIPSGSISSASYKPTSYVSGQATVYCSNSAAAITSSFPSPRHPLSRPPNPRARGPYWGSSAVSRPTGLGNSFGRPHWWRDSEHRELVPELLQFPAETQR